jgi:uncharacterized protein
MRIDVARLAANGEDFTGEDPAAILEWDADDELLYPVTPVQYRFHAEIAGHELLVRGTVLARFGGICVRCGGPLDLEVRDEAFCESLPLTEETQEVNLTPHLRESILLALPSHPVCRPDCSGVCPRCGRRLAEGACGCAEPVAQGWEALSGLDVPARETPRKDTAS